MRKNQTAIPEVLELHRALVESGCDADASLNILRAVTQTLAKRRTYEIEKLSHEERSFLVQSAVRGSTVGGGILLTPAEIAAAGKSEAKESDDGGH